MSQVTENDEHLRQWTLSVTGHNPWTDGQNSTVVAEISKNFTKSSVTKRDPPKGVRLYQPFLSVACGA